MIVLRNFVWFIVPIVQSHSWNQVCILFLKKFYFVVPYVNYEGNSNMLNSIVIADPPTAFLLSNSKHVTLDVICHDNRYLQLFSFQ